MLKEKKNLVSGAGAAWSRPFLAGAGTAFLPGASYRLRDLGRPEPPKKAGLPEPPFLAGGVF